MRIHYISYGISETGGYRHERVLFESCVAYFKKTSTVEAWLMRKNKLFRNIPAHLELVIWAFRKSNADINIVTGRTGLSAILRNLFSKRQVWVVIHNFDPRDGKSGVLKIYYRYLFTMMNRARHGRFKLIAVSPYWLDYFRQDMSLANTYLFPNLFHLAVYNQYRTTHKNAWVHLGQYSSKNDPHVIQLAKKLSIDGYYCYFSTLYEEAAKPNNGSYEVVYFENFNDYLEQMARCCCTLALTRINEGWNRIAHESLLVGTPVIGYDSGGLGDLLRESNSIIVNNIDEAYTCIRENLWVMPGKEFLEKYDISRSETYISTICTS